VSAARGADKAYAPARAAPAPARRVVPRSAPDGDRSAVRAVLARVQRAPRVGRADDASEREAVAVAERVAAGATAPVPVVAAVPSAPADVVRRQEAPVEEERPAAAAGAPAGTSAAAAGGAPAAGEAPPPAVEPQPWPEPDEAELELLAQAQAAPLVGAAGGEVPDAGLAMRLRAPGEGRPIDPEVVRRIAAVLPHDFSAVRVHDRPQAQRDAAALSARALTLGPHVWLGRGERTDDVRLMAHELTHVVQQGAAAPLEGRPRGPPAAAPDTVQRSLLPSGIAADIAAFAARIPGWRLLTVVLGRNPITDEVVDRTPATIARGVLDLVPRGDQIYENLVASGGLDRAVAGLRERLSALGITWDYMLGVLGRAWEAVSIADVVDPVAAWVRIRPIVSEPAERLVRFAVALGSWILELVVDAVLTAAGPLGARVMAVLRRARDVIGLIVADPIAFVRNLMNSVLTGFQQFAGNILGHLRTGFVDWLFGTLGGAGIQLPRQFDLRGLLAIVLQVLGLTYASIRRRLARVIGEPRLALIERALSFLGTLATQGLAGAWRQIAEWAGNLRETVVSGIQSYIRDTIVGQGIQWLLSLLTPAGVVVQAIRGIYNVVRWLIDQGERLLALAETVFDSVGNIAKGAIGDAANLVERTLGRLVPVVIALLARLAGLGDLADRIRSIIARVRERVDQALTRLVNWVVTRARALVSRALGGPGADATPQQRLDLALPEAQRAVDRFAGRAVGAVVLRPLLAAIRLRYQLTALEPFEREGRWWIRATVNPTAEGATSVLTPAGSGANVPNDLRPGVRIVYHDEVENRQNGRVTQVFEQPNGPLLVQYEVARKRNVQVLTKRVLRDDGTKAYTTELTLAGITFTPPPVTVDGKASTVDAVPLIWRGEEAPTAPVAGWDRLTTAAQWVRAHLVNARLGGRDATWNLTPTPTQVNSAMYRGHEEDLQYDVPRGREVWMHVQVTYWNDSDSTEIGRLSDFPRLIEVTYGDVVLTNGVWAPAGGVETAPPYPVRAPRRSELLPSRLAG
jgi:hypothetical protein